MADLLHVKTSFGWYHSPNSGYGSSGEGITELFTKGYSWANPFVATSSLYTGYVTGHDGTGDYTDSLPEYFSATKSGDVTLELNLNLMGKEISYQHSNMLWGYRDLYTEKDDTFTPNDTITVSQSARHLGIYKIRMVIRQFRHPVKVSWMQMQRLTEQRSAANFVEIFMKKMTAMYFTNGVAALSNPLLQSGPARWKFFCWQGWKF